MKLLSICFLFFFSNAKAVDGLSIGIAADLLYEQGLNKASSATDKMSIRGVELMFESPVDHVFNANVSAAAHDESGETVFEVHEAFLSSGKILPRTHLKVGQFFLGIGRLNRVHQHDWPFITAPKVHQAFFDKEAIFDVGAESKVLLPTIRFWELTLGLTSGHRYGHSHTAGAKPKVPTHYTRLATFFENSSTSGIESGVSFLSRTDAQSNRLMITGLDLTAKWREGKRVSFLWQNEFWYKNEEDIAKKHSEYTGLYSYAQWAMTERGSAGLRLDVFKDFSRTNSLTGAKLNNIEYGFTPIWTFKNSEFATIKTSLSHTFVREEAITRNQDTRFELQFVFIIGAHPAHSF